MHGPANYIFFKSDFRQESMARTAAHLNRAGWVIISSKLEIDWLKDFDAVYDRTERIDMDDYSAIRYAPRLKQ